MKIDDMTGEVIDELAPIRARIDSLKGERWVEKKMGNHSADVVTVDSYGEAWVVAEHAGDYAQIIAKAPDDIRYLLERVDRLEAFLKAKNKELEQARREQRWEYSKGRITNGIWCENRANLIEEQVNELEKELG